MTDKPICKRCSDCDGEHHFSPEDISFAEDNVDHEAVAAGHDMWLECRHCKAWRPVEESDYDLEAEVPDLPDIPDDESAPAPTTEAEAYARGREDERQAVADWLQSLGHHQAAAAILRGEHTL